MYIKNFMLIFNHRITPERFPIKFRHTLYVDLENFQLCIFGILVLIEPTTRFLQFVIAHFTSGDTKRVPYLARPVKNLTNSKCCTDKSRDKNNIIGSSGSSLNGKRGTINM